MGSRLFEISTFRVFEFLYFRIVGFFAFSPFKKLGDRLFAFSTFRLSVIRLFHFSDFQRSSFGFFLFELSPCLFDLTNFEARDSLSDPLCVLLELTTSQLLDVFLPSLDFLDFLNFRRLVAFLVFEHSDSIHAFRIRRGLWPLGV